jgi:hypothetical protein
MSNIDNTDMWVIRSNDFVIASQYAAKQGWALREWAWLPAYTINKDLQILNSMVLDTLSNETFP